MDNRELMFAEERKREILSFISKHKKAKVNELSERFKVSGATIRSDLRELDRDGKVLRTHGGAIEAMKAGFEPVAKERDTQNIELKKRIALAASEMVEESDTIVLDSSSTTFELAKLLTTTKNLTVVTNDFAIAQLFDDFPQINALLIGGNSRKHFHCTTGTTARGMLENLRVDKAFMAANSFSLERGASTPDFQQAEMKSLMIEIATRLILLVDSTKFGKNSLVSFAPIDRIDCLITDSIDDELKQALDEEGVEVRIAGGI